MKSIITILSLLVLLFHSKAYTQDTIFTNAGRTIICEISKEDSISVYFTTQMNDQDVNTSIKKESIQKISYNKLLKEQNWDSDSIICIKNKSKNEYYYHRQKLTTKQLDSLLCIRYSPRELVDDSKAHHAVAMVLSGGGGFLIGYSLGAAIGNGTPNWGMTGVGALCVLIGIPLELKAQNCIKKAIDAYNKEIANEKANKNNNAANQKQ